MLDPHLDRPEFAPPADAGPATVVPRTNPPRALTTLGREPLWIATAILVQVGVLLAMIAMHVLATRNAQTILLRVEPVDPRDLMRGDYVILGYQISRIPPGTILPGVTDRPYDQRTPLTVYLPLTPEPDGRHYQGAGLSTTPPASGLFIRGTTTGWNRIEFGIESYYVQEGKGKLYEDAVRSRRLSAQVALAPDGQATLRGLEIE